MSADRDRAVEAGLAFYASTEPLALDRFRAGLEAADAVDQEQGITRVGPASPDQVRDLALEIAEHHRIDANTSRDRCTCGHRNELGKLTTEHIAEQLVAQGWRKP